jgi:hypothetical protein
MMHSVHVMHVMHVMHHPPAARVPHHSAIGHRMAPTHHSVAGHPVTHFHMGMPLHVTIGHLRIVAGIWNRLSVRWGCQQAERNNAAPEKSSHHLITPTAASHFLVREAVTRTGSG